MPAWIVPLLDLLNRLAEWLKRQARLRRHEDYQESVDELQADPVEFGRNHFNRVRSDADVPNDADASSHADTEQLDDERAGRGKPGSPGH